MNRCWKLYSIDEPARTFASRQAAITAAESAARSALAEGAQVELYLQDEDGHFQQAPTASLGH